MKIPLKNQIEEFFENVKSDMDYGNPLEGLYIDLKSKELVISYDTILSYLI